MKEADRQPKQWTESDEKRWREWGSSPEDQREMRRAIAAAGGLEEN